MKISKHYRVDPDRLKDLEKIQKHLADRFKAAAEMTGTKYTAPTATDSLEFAIKYCFDTLKKEGDIK
jgi:hypothetical protein